MRSVGRLDRSSIPQSMRLPKTVRLKPVRSKPVRSKPVMLGGLLAAALMWGTGTIAAQEPMRILTYPTGLVVGELKVEVDLGSQGQAAELFLNGQQACELSPSSTSCNVDLGPDPHIHLLELVRGRDRVERWLNRPGQEAELVLSMVKTENNVCGARISWAHPQQQNPTEIEVTLAGSPTEISADGRAVRFPCPETKSESAGQVLVAMAVFPDGRRVETVETLSGFGDATSVELSAVPLMADAQIPCETGAAGWPAGAEKLEQSGFEVVLVLDPDASYVPLRNSGWNTGRLANNDGAATKVFDSIVRSGASDSEPEPKNSWLKAKTTIFDAERLWYVAPDEGLHRVNGFGQGKPNWLDLLFRYGLANVPGKPRIADAVAASGLVAAAGPRRRAVVLILGNNVQKRDGSRFSPQQAQAYLAEVNVPFFVLRNGKRREDGWPAGLPALNMESMSRSLRDVRDVIDRQCVAWFSSQQTPTQLAATLPTGVRLAGYVEDSALNVESVWARAELPEPLPEPAGLTAERLDITAVSVVVSALDAKGAPVSNLTTADFTLLEDGAPVTVLGLAPVSRKAEPTEIGLLEAEAVPSPPEAAEESKDLPVAIYVNRTVGGGFDQRQALRAIVGQLDRLAAMGPVEVVVAEKEQVRSLVGPTRDLAQISTALDELAGRKTGQHAIERIRQRFVQDIRRIPNRFTTDNLGDGGLTKPNEQSKVTFAARSAAGEEHIIVSRALAQLRFWAQRETGQRAGLLVVVGAGFDEDPIAFYGPWISKLEPHNTFQLREDLRSLKKEASVNNLGRELAATGWRILAVAGQTVGSSTGGADSRTDKFQSFLSASTDAIHAVDSSYLLLDPIDSQRNLAEASGGDVVIGPAGLERELDKTSGWYVLTYQVARPPDGASHTIDLQPVREGLKIATNQLITAATSEGQAEARVRRLLGGVTEQGELAIDLDIGAPTAGDGKKLVAEVEATVHFADLASLVRPGSTLRVSIGVLAGDDLPAVEHRQERLQEASAGWIYKFPTQWKGAANARLAVTVEDVASGLWGSAIVDLPEGL